MAHTVIETYEDYFKLPRINFKMKYGETRYYEIEKFTGSFEFLEAMELTLYKKAKILNTSQSVYERHLEAYHIAKSTMGSTQQRDAPLENAHTTANSDIIQYLLKN